MYKVATYLTPEQKARALQQTYTPIYRDEPLPEPRTEGGGCPLGVALTGDEVAPMAKTLTRLIVEENNPNAPHYAIYSAVRRFTRDFDRGRIKNLATALGIKV